ncbi:GID complex subunit 4, VID24 [Dimargaris verticillata]|uniref:GID complex subunit 4, VID24 n=1 Tax=Dimargaris verticillata TaxID=2761393 RepID=A0A9W8B8M4_9FUNG|nr:GID complex subunit 4, VID24 [Dimargaris verticillata]
MPASTPASPALTAVALPLGSTTDPPLFWDVGSKPSVSAAASCCGIDDHDVCTLHENHDVSPGLDSGLDDENDPTYFLSSPSSTAESTIRCCSSRRGSASSASSQTRLAGPSTKWRKLRTTVELIYESLAIPPSPKPLYTEHLYPGSRFVGQQSNNDAFYKVEITVQHVDLNRSVFCGYFTIHDLTPEFPLLTTYFESEIVGAQHGFRTRTWASTRDNDCDHWHKFAAYNTYPHKIDEEHNIRRVTHEDAVFMRWKEMFLVPDHRLEKVTGASFEGFYFVCYEQSTGAIIGYYYHGSSTKYQQLTLHHVGTFASPQFELS